MTERSRARERESMPKNAMENGNKPNMAHIQSKNINIFKLVVLKPSIAPLCVPASLILMRVVCSAVCENFMN